MTSLYKQSVPVLIKYLKNFSALLKKGENFADEKSLKHEQILDYRLVPDMQGLKYQVHSCCNTAVWFVDRVGELEHVVVEDNEETFEQLYQRIDRTVSYLEKVDAAKIDANVDAPVLMKTRMGDFSFASGQAYFSEFALANFHFHLSSAYCILRTQGVPLNALDYLRDVFTKVEA